MPQEMDTRVKDLIKNSYDLLYGHDNEMATSSLPRVVPLVWFLTFFIRKINSSCYLSKARI